ncbi:uncharacterized protein LOC144464625 [Epinephelus lanceolatus]
MPKEDLDDAIANAISSTLLAQQSELSTFIQSAVKEVVNSILVPQLAELTRQIKDTNDTVSQLAQGLESSHKTIQSNTAKLDTLQATVRANNREVNGLQQQVGELTSKITQMEDPSWRSNVRLVGLKEGKEGSDAIGFLSTNLPKWIPSLGNRDIRIERLLDYSDRQAVLKGARVQHDGHPLLFFPDYSREKTDRRREFAPVHKKITSLGLQPFLLYPAQLKIIYNGTITFGMPHDAEDFLQNTFQPPPALRRRLKGRDFTAASATKNVVICGAHFTPEDYIPGDMMECEMGFRHQNRVRLRVGAVPSLHTAASSAPPLAAVPAPSQLGHSSARRKRELRRVCACGYQHSWQNQPMLNRNMPACNLLLSGAIHFSGCMATQTLRMLKLFGLQCISAGTFFHHQRLYTIPTIVDTWQTQQTELVRQLKEMGGGLILSGDCRSVSPGHCAKYGTYSLIEDRVNNVMDLQLVQSSEVPSSNWCELEGLKRSIAFLEEQDMTASALITDRSRQVAKWVREEMCPQGTRHFFDIWHIGKSIGKALDVAAKERGCEDLKLWKPAIINHLYWTAASTPDGNPNIMQAKWESMVNHVLDIHEHDTPTFTCCAHPPLEGEARDKAWLEPGSNVAIKLESVATRPALVKDIRQLSHSTRPSLRRHFTPSCCTLPPSTPASPFLGCTAGFSWQPCITTTMAAERLPGRVMVRPVPLFHTQGSAKHMHQPSWSL